MNNDQLTIGNDQLPEEYQQTEVGVIPEDWRCESLAGKILITHGFGFQSQYFSSQGSYHLTTPGNFYEEGGFRELGEKQKYYEGSFPDGYLLRPGDLIVAMTEQADGLLGSAAIIPETGKYLHNQRLGKVNLISSSIELSFLYYIFNSRKFRAKVQETAAGTKVKHTSPNKLLEIAIPYPYPGEQRSIAQALSDVDALIAGLDKAIAKKRAIKTATMQQLLTGKKRLPGFGEGKGDRRTEIGVIPEDWKPYTFGEVVSFSGGSQPPRSTFGFKPRDGYIRLIQIRDYKTDTYATYIPAELAKKICTQDDVMIGRYGPPIFQILRGIAGAYNVALMKAIPSEKIDKEFLYHFIQNEELFKLMEMLSQRSSGQTGVELPALRQYPLALPSMKEQRAIATVLSDMDTEIAALETRLAKTQSIKQGMMQQLLTGKVRLKIEAGMDAGREND